MLATDASASAQLADSVRGVAWLVELDFLSGTLRVTSSPLDITTGGHTYTALGGLMGIANLQESADTAADRLTLSLAITNSAQLALAMGDPAGYRGRQARIYLQVFDQSFVPVGAAVKRWQGYMDKVQIERKPADEAGGEAGGSINMICSRAGMARARNAEGLRLNDAQQQSKYPGDTGLRYVRTLIEQPSLWLSKRFQEV